MSQAFTKPEHVGVDLAEPGGDATLMIPSEHQQQVEAVVARQASAALEATRSKQALLYTPQGLRGLFPTNLVSTKLVRRR